MNILNVCYNCEHEDWAHQEATGETAANCALCEDRKKNHDFMSYWTVLYENSTLAVSLHLERWSAKHADDPTE